MSAPNGDPAANGVKRPLEHSPTQAAQPGTSLFGSNDNPASRTIYSQPLAQSPFPPSNGNNSPALDGGGNGQDDYATGAIYQGQRTTGMGRQPSDESSTVGTPGGNSVMNPMSPQDQPRKRLRRGGPAGEGDEGPGSFTANLQTRLADVHVKSEAPSESGSASASMAPTPSYAGSVDVKPSPTSAHLTVQGGSPAMGGMRAMGSPSMGYANYPPQQQQQQQQQQRPQGQPGAPAQAQNIPMEDPAFRAFVQQVGPAFSVDKCWAAFQRHPHDFTAALAALLDAKPVANGSPAPGAQGSPAPQYNAAAAYAAVNPPVATGSPAPGTPGAMHPQQQQYAAALAQAQAAGRVPPQQMQPGVRGPPGAYPPQQQQQQMRAANGVPVQGMTPQQAQQYQQLVYQQAIAQGRAPPGSVPRPGAPPQQQQRQQVAPAAASFYFPPAGEGVAGMTPAHVAHYLQLQKAYHSSSITNDEYNTLKQYINVIRKFEQQKGTAQQPQQAGYPPGAYPPGAYPPAGYGPQGVYAPGPGGQQYQSQFRTMPPHGMYPPQGGHPGYPPHYGQQQQQRPPQQAPKPPPPKAAPPATSGSILARQLQLASGAGASSKKKAKKRAYASDSDDDGGDYDSAGSGDEYGSRENPALVAKREALAVEFFNSCTKEMLMELAGCNATQATLTMKLRPFSTANDFRTRTRKQKGVGNNMMDTYLDVVTGMGEVDKVLSECEAIGRELNGIMQVWASGAAVTAATNDATKPGASGTNEVGLDLVAISEETIATRVDTSNDPRVREAFKDYIRKQPEGVPDSIHLKDYQMLGVNWLNLLYRRGTSCILADEMGLGKTAQVIALLAHLKATDEPGPHLVIVPSSTLDNWMREFSVFAPNLVVRSYYGSQGERYELRGELRNMEDLDVVVTTYNIATGSPDDQKFLKRKMDFKVTVFDEGHQLKNSESKKYKDLMQVRAEWRLLLTGTPLQNNLQELVSLLSFILPDQFRDANESLRAIFKVQPGSATNLLSRERIMRAKKMMTPFVLRRKKAQVLKDLPEKTERIEYCDMTDLQREVYDEAIFRSRKALVNAQEEELDAMGSEEEDAPPGAEDPDVEKKPARRSRPKKVVAPSTKMGNKADTTSSAHVLTDLRKASNHPMLFRRLYDEKILKQMARDCLKEEEFLDRNKDLIFEDMEVMTDFELHRFCLTYKQLNKYALKNDEWMSAGKIAKLLELLPAMKERGDRVLIFSQFTQVLDILEVVLDTMRLKYLKLTGQTAVSDRQNLVDAFNKTDDITVFLLSTRAGGLGLNLTAANTVIFYDCDYNPHNDKQAEDRCYRIGQTRQVNIIRLVTKGSLDEAMYELASTKLKLDAEVSGQGAGKAEGQAEGEGEETGSAERRMKKSLLSGLKQQFERDTQTKA
ncbi:DNA-dependent ATPase fun30 [Rhodotorula kratochvilovae]